VIIEEGGKIESEISNKNKITINKNVKPRQDPTQPAEKGAKDSAVGDDDVFFNYNAVGGTIFEATEFVRVAGGINSTIDMTGNPPGTPLIVCPGPIEIFADNILLDPGVFLEDLCGPGPVFSGPAQPIIDVACVSFGDTTGYAGFPLEVQFQVANMGNVPEDFEIIWEDSLGWGPPPDFSQMYRFPDGTDPWESTFTIPVDVPPWVLAGQDTNSLRLTVHSVSNPAVTYSENILVPVADIAELKDVGIALWGINLAPAGASMSVEHWISNDGAMDDEYAVAITNQLNWPMPPLPPSIFVPAQDDVILMSDMEIPFGVPDGTPNEVYITLESLSSPGVAFTDTVQILVNMAAHTEPDLQRATTIEHRCFPNPFNPQVVISFAVPVPNAFVTVGVYDVSGHRTRILHEGILNGRNGEFTWDGTDSTGQPVASGVYFYRISAGGHSATGKMMLTK